ncbi:MAG: ATP-binding protein, partial [Trueperaceae bacterium]
AESEIRDVERLSRATLSEVRSVVRGYRVTGFSGELANAKLALEAANIGFDYFVGSLQLQPAAEGVLALALREAVTNVVRHAGATTCRATLDADQAFVTLTVEDNGRGTVAAQEPASDEPGGFGLGAMRERARALGGFVSVQPSAGANRTGTRVSVSLPVAAALQTEASAEQAIAPAERPAAT